MPRDRARKDDDEKEREEFWKGLGKDLLVAAIIVVVFLVGIYAYTGVWPPLVVVESSSMQHSDRESFFGVIDTGDMVFQQAAPDRASVITYLEGRANGYAAYSDYGDVIIFRRAGDPVPVIHRAIMYVALHANGTADVPDLAGFSDWQAVGDFGPTTTNPYFLHTVTIHHMGFNHNLGITFDFGRYASLGARSGYITMGDHNAYLYCSSFDPCVGTPYDPGWIVRQEDVIGRARGEIPWFGLLKLTLSPTDSCCARGWGDPEAPKNSWDSLAVSLVVLFALPFALEYGVRGWKRYVSPRLPEVRWPWQRWTRKHVKTENPREPAGSDSADPDESSKKPPREESSEP